MSNSNAMDEIRKIRDENSIRHLAMSSEELTKELAVATENFIKLLGKDIPIVSK